MIVLELIGGYLAIVTAWSFLESCGVIALWITRAVRSQIKR